MISEHWPICWISQSLLINLQSLMNSMEYIADLIILQILHLIYLQQFLVIRLNCIDRHCLMIIIISKVYRGLRLQLIWLNFNIFLYLRENWLI